MSLDDRKYLPIYPDKFSVRNRTTAPERWLCLCSVAPFMEYCAEVVNLASSRPLCHICLDTLNLNRLSK